MRRHFRDVSMSLCRQHSEQRHWRVYCPTTGLQITGLHVGNKIANARQWITLTMNGNALHDTKLPQGSESFQTSSQFLSGIGNKQHFNVLGSQQPFTASLSSVRWIQFTSSKSMAVKFAWILSSHLFVPLPSSLFRPVRYFTVSVLQVFQSNPYTFLPCVLHARPLHFVLLTS
jgi:hypothetical protein